MFRPALALCALSLLLAPAAADAALLRLDEAQLRATGGGQDASQAGAPVPAPGWLNLLLNAPGASRHAESAAVFQAELAQRGAGPLPASVYDGRDVTRVDFSGAPFDASIDLARLLAPGAAASVHLGQLQLSRVDLGSTVFWVWGH